jgi:transcriptional regulator of heat shock response
MTPDDIRAHVALAEVVLEQGDRQSATAKMVLAMYDLFEKEISLCARLAAAPASDQARQVREQLDTVLRETTSQTAERLALLRSALAREEFVRDQLAAGLAQLRKRLEESDAS